MKILDKIVLNRLLSIISSFILGLIKIFDHSLDNKKPKRKKILPWRSKDE
jgi:hypothetical protein